MNLLNSDWSRKYEGNMYQNLRVCGREKINVYLL
jgi:hypothetical protein